jgi:predicted RNA-binding Zn ribbon-like protein
VPVARKFQSFRWGIALNEPGPTRFIFVAEDLALDLLNTEIVAEGQGRDLLQTWDDLVAWARQAGVTHATARRVEPSHGGRWVSEARELRAAILKGAEATRSGKRIPQFAVTAINRWMARSCKREQLAWSGSDLIKKADMDDSKPAQWLAAVAEAAADLFVGPRAASIRRCEGAGCILWFLDLTRNHSRRWCSMETCGNRMKAAQYRQKARSAR